MTFQAFCKAAYHGPTVVSADVFLALRDAWQAQERTINGMILRSALQSPGGDL